MAETKSFLDFAHELADAAGDAAMPYFRDVGQVEDKQGKAGFDPVTVADRAAEKIMRDMIGSAYPDHNIRGEEFGVLDNGSQYTWVLDPIDGTRSFILGIPLWGTLVGLTYEGEPIIGLMSQPYTGEIFSGDGKTAFLGTAPLKTRPCKRLEDAMLATTDPRLFANEQESEVFGRIEAATRMSRYGGDCYLYCMLAAGQIDLVVESGLSDYDIAALVPIIEGAGGIVTTWEGGSAAGGGRIIAAGDPGLHQIALEMLNP